MNRQSESTAVKNLSLLLNDLDKKELLSTSDVLSFVRSLHSVRENLSKHPKYFDLKAKVEMAFGNLQEKVAIKDRELLTSANEYWSLITNFSTETMPVDTLKTISAEIQNPPLVISSSLNDKTSNQRFVFTSSRNNKLKKLSHAKAFNQTRMPEYGRKMIKAELHPFYAKHNKEGNSLSDNSSRRIQSFLTDSTIRLSSLKLVTNKSRKIKLTSRKRLLEV